MKKYTLVAKQTPDGAVQDGGIVICGMGHCPAVLKTADGKAIVVGRLLSKDEHAAISADGTLSFHDGEFAVEVSPELLRKATSHL